MHTHALVNLLGTVVTPVDVQADAANPRVLACQRLEVAEEGAEHAVATVGGLYVHRLDPQEEPVAPVAPLECGHQLSDRLAVELRDVVVPEARIVEHRLHAGPQQCGVERLPLGFRRERGVGLGYELQVGPRCFPYFHRPEGTRTRGRPATVREALACWSGGTSLQSRPSFVGR